MSKMSTLYKIDEIVRQKDQRIFNFFRQGGIATTALF